MKTFRILKKCVIVLLVLGILFALCSCGSTSKLEGNWVCEVARNGYPDQMTLSSDGTGTADGYSCNWYEEDGILHLNVGNAFIGSKSYGYHFEGSTLYLNEFAYHQN